MPQFDVIVIGSGMGGMSCAAAWARNGRKVLLLEQYQTIGGQSHSFARDNFRWDVGLHYLGGLAPDEPERAILDWLTEGRIEFAPMGPVYDTLYFPDGFTLQLSRPEAAQRQDLKERFPNSVAEIDAWFDAMREGAEAMKSIFQARAIPEPFGNAVGWWNHRRVERWCGRTLGEVIAETTGDARLAAVLGSQWGDHGGRPSTGCFGTHAIAVGSYLSSGAYYPVGGARSFAEHMIPTIEAAGGEARSQTLVTGLVVEDGAVVGVKTADGATLRAKAVVSNIGAREPVSRLLPENLQQSDWGKEVLSFGPSLCHFSLFLGFEGDIEAAGATRSHQWYFDSWSIDGVWTDPIAQSEPPGLFVSFASLKDPAHYPGPSQRYAGEVVVTADWSMVEAWANFKPGERGPDYAAMKSRIEAAMLASFTRHLPRLAPLIVFRELATPLATAAITGHDRGGFYGLENTPRRMMTKALRMKTPIPGLFLSGQDVVTPGILGAMWGGVLAGASIEPRIFQHLHG
jgi:all-trans-retinol 13,14-reductase